MPVDPSVAITVDASWATDPDVAPSWLSVPPVESIAVRPRGRSYELDTVTPTTSTIRVDNTDGTYTSGATIAGTGKVDVDKRIRVRAALTPGSTYTILDHTISECPTTIDGDGFGYASNNFQTVDYSDALSATTLQSTYIENMLSSLEAPNYYFPLGEDAGSNAAGDLITGISAPLTGFNSTLVSAAAFGGTPFFPSTDPTTNFALSPHDSAGVWDSGQWLQLGNGGLGAYLETTTWTARATVVTTDATHLQTVFSQANTDDVSAYGTKAISIYVYFGYVVLYYPVGGGAGRSSIGGSTFVADGLPHIISARSTATDVYLYVDGVLSDSSSTPTIAAQRTGPVAIGAEVYNGNYARYFFKGQIGHVALWANSAPSLATYHYQAALGFLGDDIPSRIARTLGWVGFAGSQTYDYSSVLLGPQSCSGKSALTEIQEAAAADPQSLFFFAADGTSKWRSHTVRYVSTPVVTLGTDTLPVDTSGLQFGLDRQHMINDLKATRNGGGIIRATNPVSIPKHRRRDLGGSPMVFNVDSDDALYQAANWYTFVYGTSRVRCGRITLRPATSPQLWQYALTLESGDRVDVSGLPSNAPASTMQFIVESVAWPTLTADGDAICELQLSPFIPVFIVGDATYGVVGTAGYPIAL